MTEFVVIKVRLAPSVARRLSDLAHARRWTRERFIARAGRVVADVLEMEFDPYENPNIDRLLCDEERREHQSGEAPPKRGRPRKTVAA
jgi:hypothetical protein